MKLGLIGGAGFVVEWIPIPTRREIGFELFAALDQPIEVERVLRAIAGHHAASISATVISAIMHLTYRR
jgi:hypothetical protein